MTATYLPGLHHSVSERDYHADNLCEVPTLSCSLAKVLISQSPKHAWCAHPRLGNLVHREPTPAMEFGSAAHKLCLGKGADIAVLDEDSWRGSKASSHRELARERGAIPLLAKDYDRATQQRDALHRQLGEIGILDQFNAATPEVVMVYKDASVLCRAMLDKLIIDEASKRATIYDVKTTDSANPAALGRLIWNMSYDLQDQSYIRGVELVRPDLAGRVEMVFLFIETEFPFSLTRVVLNGEFKTLGMSKWSRAWTMWKACLRTGEWPSYPHTLLKAEPPGFALASEMGANAIMPTNHRQ